jgi:hypothetical protein
MTGHPLYFVVTVDGKEARFTARSAARDHRRTNIAMGKTVSAVRPIFDKPPPFKVERK